MTEALQLESVRVQYRGAGLAVTDATLSVSEGECAVVLGPNGAGKTSLLRAIAGFPPAMRVKQSGTVRFRGRDIAGWSSSTIANRGIAYIPERDKIFRSLTVQENLAITQHRRPKSAGRGQEDIDYAYDVFPELVAVPRERKAGLLSGGQQQMLALAGALVAAPSVLLVDEPSLGLAPKLVADVMSALLRIRTERGVAVILVDQNVRSTARVATSIFTMASGRLTQAVGEAATQALLREGYSALQASGSE